MFYVEQFGDIQDLKGEMFYVEQSQFLITFVALKEKE